MKLVYVCECCGTIAHSLEVEEHLTGEIQPSLTGLEPRNIINMSGGGRITLNTICEDCLEDMYGIAETTYLRGPVIN